MSVKSTDGFNGFPIPIGSVLAYAGSLEDGLFPPLFKVCDGTNLLESEYPELFSVIGATYGSAGAGFFALPDLVGFVPKCANVAGVVNATSTSTVVIDPITLTSAEIPSIPNMTINANINGGFEAGSSDSSIGKIDENTLLPDRYIMTSWNTTGTVNMSSNSAPVFDYANGTGVVAPVTFDVVDADTADVENVEMVFIIKAKSGFF
jgi:microcystin-dependent protein